MNSVQITATSSAVPNRPRVILTASAILVLVALGLLIYWLLVNQYRETTEDAYVNGNIVAVTAQVGGVVTKIAADNTDYVRAGKPLITLDGTDAQLALTQAEAQLAKTVRQVRGQFANVGQTRATLKLKEVVLTKATAAPPPAAATPRQRCNLK